MKNPNQNSADGLASTLLEALDKANSQKRDPEDLRTPFEVAKDAYFVCHPHDTEDDYVDWEADHNRKDRPKVQLYRHLKHICERARSHASCPRSLHWEILNAERDFLDLIQVLQLTASNDDEDPDVPF